MAGDSDAKRSQLLEQVSLLQKYTGSLEFGTFSLSWAISYTQFASNKKEIMDLVYLVLNKMGYSSGMAFDKSATNEEIDEFFVLLRKYAKLLTFL